MEKHVSHNILTMHHFQLLFPYSPSSQGHSELKFVIFDKLPHVECDSKQGKGTTLQRAVHEPQRFAQRQLQVHKLTLELHSCSGSQNLNEHRNPETYSCCSLKEHIFKPRNKYIGNRRKESVCGGGKINLNVYII